MTGKAPHREVAAYLGGPTREAESLARYIGARIPGKRKKDEQSRLKYWGLNVPSHRQAAKARYSFSALIESDQWKVWLKVWSGSQVYDVKCVALLWLCDPKRRELRLERWKDLVQLASHIDNWAHSDMLSSALAEILESRPALLQYLKKWNRSSNPWLRRQSLVGIYCYARMRKKKVKASIALALVKARLQDPHFYVQRGVGWTLREIDRVDSKAQRAFVRRNLGLISSTAWFATSEFYPVQLRTELVRLRKSAKAQ
ncbi:MAG: DNA alkylation repair protein [Bdellovibrionales bacterium]